MRYHYTLTRMVKINKKTGQTNLAKDVEQLELLCIADMNTKSYSAPIMENSLAVSYKAKHTLTT